MTLDLTGKRLPWDRASAWAVTLAAGTTFAVYVVVIAAYFDRTFDYIRYPFGIDYGEGPILFQVTALAAGESIYQPIAQTPYAVTNYPPLFHIAAGLLTNLVGDPLVAGRLVSFLGALASGMLIFSLVQGALHREHGPLPRRAGGALAALFFLTHYTVIGWSATMRVDTLALAFGLLAMQVFVLSFRRPSLAWAWGLIFVLAAYTKPNMFAAALATFGTGYFLYRRRMMAAAVVCLGAGLAAAVVLNTATGGEFLKHVVWYNLNEYRLDLILKRLQQSLFWRSVDIVLAFGFFFYLAARLVARRRGGVGSAGPSAADVPLMLFGGLLAASLINVVGSGKTGASVSYFLEFEAAAALLLGTLAVRVATHLSAEAWSPSCRRRRVLAVVALAILCWQATVGWNVKFRGPDWGAVTYSQRVADLLATADGPVVSEEMVLLHRAGRPLYFQPFIMSRLARDGRWDPAPLTQAMTRGEIPFVVLYSAIGTERYLRRFPDGFRMALESRYRLREQVGHLGIYVPH